MAPQSPGALQEEVEGRKVRDQEVEVQIERLLDHLGRDQHARAVYRISLA
jgi:hypothetical protein